MDLDKLITSNMRGYSPCVCNYDNCKISTEVAFIANIGSEVFFFRFCREHARITPSKWDEVSLNEALVLEIMNS
jgi:hypothetical protein